jgi:hypothetical protein
MGHTELGSLSVAGELGWGYHKHQPQDYPPPWKWYHP